MSTAAISVYARRPASSPARPAGRARVFVQPLAGYRHTDRGTNRSATRSARRGRRRTVARTTLLSPLPPV